MKELRELGRMDEAATLAREKGNQLQLRQIANRAQRNLTQINKRIENVRRSTMTAVEKRRELDRLNVMKSQITGRFGGMFEDAKARA